MKPFDGHIAVDLDGTLAFYDGWKGPEHIGEPIPLMLDRVKGWLAGEIEVRILTARACSDNPVREVALPAIKAWCVKHIGQELPITAEKTYETLELWDDRAVQIEANTGKRIDEPSFTWKEEDGLQVCYMGLLQVGWASEKKYCVFFSGGWDKVSCTDLPTSKAHVEGYARGRWREAHGLSRYPKGEPKKEG